MAEIILTESAERPVAFAASELARYLHLLTGQPLAVQAAPAPAEATVRFTLAIANPGSDDAFTIAPEGAGYRLTGSNPRSVVFAVYRYLRELGVRWLRPGATGEVLPRLSSPLPKTPLTLSESAGYRYRTICIEGSCSREHVLDLVDWSAKQGMNGYFLQFELGITFFKWWYIHQRNPFARPEPFADAQVVGIVHDLSQALQERGLTFERVGHGWTSKVAGVRAESWEESVPPATAEQKPLLAELNGQRDWFRGQPLNTNLCYANPVVRQRFAAEVLAYSQGHPECQLLHLWLADGSNNHCECAACATQRPADWYVALLNDCDAALSAAGLATRLVFLIYVDLLWPPVRERLANPARFVLMFAPITRVFSKSFAEASVPAGPLPEFVRNKLVFPKDVGANIACLRAWQEQFGGDGFDFDYHGTWAPFYDINQVTIARVFHRDIQHLRQLGLHGYNSCQMQRLSFPHNLLMEVMARTLWNPALDYETIARESFRDAFGREDGERVREFFTELSALWLPLFEPAYIPAPDAPRIRQGLANLPLIEAAITGLRPALPAGRMQREPAVRQSWEYLAHYLDLLPLLLSAFEAYLRCQPSDCKERFERFFDELWRREPYLHPVLDVHRAVTVYRWRIHECQHDGKPVV